MRASRPHSADTLAPGQRIGPYVLLAPLGAGGSGRIWAVARVGQLGFSKRMALKVMRHDKLANARARERFDREACLCGRLNHPGVRAVHDLGSHEGRPFMAMSWVDTSLAELLEHAPGHALSPSVVCWLGMQCCSALAAAHGFSDTDGTPRPIVHRDISPGNILLTVDGHALLADLTAPATEPSASPRPDAPADTRFFGSLGYAAPEALRQEPLDGRADLFSLGCVLFEALAGAPAFEGDDERSLIVQILDADPQQLARRLAGVPAPLVALVSRCLERRPELRFQSALELRRALSDCCCEHGSFELERESARVIRELLGTRLREREEAIHLAFQRFARSAFERTDTLPIARSRDEPPALPEVSIRVERGRDTEGELSRSGAGMALSQRQPARRRPLWLLLAGLAGLLLVYGMCTGSPAPSVLLGRSEQSLRAPAVVPAPSLQPPAQQSPAMPPSPAPAAAPDAGARAPGNDSPAPPAASPAPAQPEQRPPASPPPPRRPKPARPRPEPAPPAKSKFQPDMSNPYQAAQQKRDAAKRAAQTPPR